MDEYEPTLAGRAVEEFVDSQLSNWYVRLSRRRFWKGEYEKDKICAYQTLYECLETIVKLIAPVSPFFADSIFRNLNSVTGIHSDKSIHHTLYPVSEARYIDQDLEDRMQLAQDASSLILSIRKKVNIRVRQPLQKALIPVTNSLMQEQLQKVEDLIKAEVNIKEIQYLSPDNDFIHKKVRPNFVMLGKKLGSKMKQVSDLISTLTQEDIRRLEADGQLELLVDNQSIVILVSEVEIQSEDVPGWIVASKNALTVALDIQVSPALEQEGNARELVYRIQKIRKDNGYDLTDRILVKVSENERMIPSITQYYTYICAEILADELEWVPHLSEGTEIEVNDIQLNVFVSKKG